MAKGFKDSSGKFHPTGNNGTSSREKSISTSGMKHLIEKLQIAKVLDVRNPLSESSTQRKQEAMLEKLNDYPNAVLSNREIDWIKNTINRESEPANRSEFTDMVFEKIEDSEMGIAIDEQANDKGEEFLKRKPIFERTLGQREQAVVKNFDEFRLVGFFDSGNQFSSFYVPLWRALSTNGDSFEYYFSGGEIHITG